MSVVVVPPEPAAVVASSVSVPARRCNGLLFVQPNWIFWRGKLTVSRERPPLLTCMKRWL